MDKLLIELKIEILKFQKNKYEVFIMHSMASNNFETISFARFKISYICKSLKFLKFYAKHFRLNENNCPWNEFTFENAAKNGNIRIMKWLKKNNCPWIEWTFTYAAENGNIKIMKWLKKHNCPWDKWTFSYAARSGNLKNMKWLKKHNCPWHEETFTCAAEKGILKNMKWLKENNCQWDTNK